MAKHRHRYTGGFSPREYARLTKGYAIHAANSDDEPHFSWSPCDTCGSRLGGNRSSCVLTNPGLTKAGKRRSAVEVESCDDCIYYAAYGHLPGEVR